MSPQRHWLLRQLSPRGAQDRPQAPQWFTFPGRDAHSPSQQLSPTGQARSGPHDVSSGTQTPSSQVWPVGQVIGHPLGMSTPTTMSTRGVPASGREVEPSAQPKSTKRPSEKPRSEEVRDIGAVDLQKGARQDDGVGTPSWE